MSFMTKEQILKRLQAGEMITPKYIQYLIEEHSHEASLLKHKHDYYSAKRLEIDHRLFNDPLKINNQLNNDFMGNIIDQVVGYMFGKNIMYGINQENYTDSAYKEYTDLLDNLITRNDLFDLDAETGKMASICGVAYRLCYIDRHGLERVMSVNPWEVILLQENDETLYGLRYYTGYDSKGRETVFAEFYDETNIYYFESKTTTTKSNFALIEKKPHLFEGVPIIEFLNNSEKLGDFDKVKSLIDAYDRLVSDTQNELEEFRQAYMVFDGGAEITSEVIQAARQSGAFSLPEGSKAYFLVKQVDVNVLDYQKKTLETNIYKFSQSVDMSDENFSGGTQSGESRKWKLIDLENKAMTKERKFIKGLHEQFRIICSSLNKKSISALDHLDIYFSFRRNLPVDLEYLAKVATELKGTVSQKTILELLPFVDDVEYEIAQLEEERELQLEDSFSLMMTKETQIEDEENEKKKNQDSAEDEIE